MQAHKSIRAGSLFPAITVPKHGGRTLQLGKPKNGLDWQMIVVYRGKHCPMCTTYLKTLSELTDQYADIGVDIVAVSADTQARAEEQIALITPKFDVGYGLSLMQMQQLGLYISDPRSEAESDRPFAEPGLFVVNDKGLVQILDISNAPFARPDFKTLLGGINFVRNPDNNYPIRGMHAA